MTTPSGCGICGWSRSRSASASGVEQAPLRGHTDQVQSVSFSPAGESLVSGGDDCTLRLWDVASREPRNILKGHTERVWCVRFSPDGQTLASTSVDGAVKL